MTTKAAFAADEWDLIADSPFLVQVAMTSHRAGGGKLSGKEYTRTLEETLATVKSNSELVQEVVAVNKDRVFTDSPTFNTVKNQLQQIGTLLEEKVDDQEEADALRSFLLTIGQKVSESTSEGLFGMGDKVSDKELELLDTLKVALKATEADEKRRADEDRAEAKAKAEAERKKKEAEAKAKAEAEQKKKEAEAKAKAAAEAERKKKEAEAKAKADAEQKKKEAEAKAKAEAERKKEAEAKAKAEAAQKKKEAEAKAKAEAAQKKKETKAKAAKDQPEQTLRIYEVKAGDSLSKIAQAVYGDLNRWKDIYEANKDKIPNPDVIEVGQRLVLPADAPQQAASRMYEVKAGDSLSKIAKEMYGQASRWEEIFEANKDQIKDPSMIHPGQKLRIP